MMMDNRLPLMRKPLRAPSRLSPCFEMLVAILALNAMGYTREKRDA